ncbi:sensor domain-containing diguanylate cyclase [Saccharibacillus alkalitolerans]|uniref:Sensor domain-containing diguanylate cyclase n=1 Tax=Saccharibacillus alkalitolerans TaxID=2705290 RepID=A0ABX0F198_9BACL|nr:sensor domain-containing diguanylate cyclase [Saccharibacillus alkalitolerans]NGZ74752.1 sensor domain-containing diguanylate cyclase [Saccharibacillus alkalitolerans]
MIIQDIASREPFKAASHNVIEVLRRSVDVDSLFIAVNDKVENFILTAVNKREQLIEAGTSLPFEETYCKLVCGGGKMATVIPDTKRDRLTAALDVTGKLGRSSFVGVPLLLGNGEAFGTICALDKRARIFTTQELELFQSMAELLSHVLTIEYDRYKDTITDAFNRKFLEAIQRSHDMTRHRLSALYVDLNGFKDINLNYGHAYGDGLLAKSARILIKLCGENAALIRLQADQFVALIPETHPIRVTEQAQAALTALGKIQLPCGGYLTASIGAALSDPWTASINDLIHCADTKMLSVKSRSGHGIAY